MKLAITPKEHFSLATVTTPGSEIVKAIITIDIHREHTLGRQVTQELYPDILLSGAGPYSRDQFLHEVNLLGASIDISITDDRVSFTLRSTATQCKKLLRLFSLMLREPRFDAKELKRVKSTALNQLHQAKEDSKTIAWAGLRNTFYGLSDRKYRHSHDDAMLAVPKVTTAQLKKLHQEILENKWVCSIGGTQKIIDLFAAEIKKLTSQPTQDLEGIHQPKPPKATLALEHISSRQNIDLSIGVPIPITRAHPDFIPLTFAVAILAKWGGFAGRLMSTVREKEGLTYGIYGQLEGFSGGEQGYLRIMTFFAPDKTVTGLTSTFREISNLYEKGVSAKEVAAFKTILSTQQALLQDSLGRVLGNLHSYHCEGFTLAEMKTHMDSLSQVTKADINAAIKTYLDPTQMSVSAAGPVNAIKKELKQWHQSVQ